MAKRDRQLNAKDIATLDKIMHEPARLSIAACLYVVESADFVFLQSQTGMTGGNLSSHLKKLDEAGYLSIEKSFDDSRPKTTLALTKAGRAAFDGYVKTISAMLNAIG